MTQRVRVWMAVVAIATVVAYWPALKSPFIFDDTEAIALNSTIVTLWPPWAPLKPPSEGPTAGRPVANLSFAISYAINDFLGINDDPDAFSPGRTVVFRATNLLLHLACGMLLFGIIRRTIDSTERLRDWWTTGGLSPEDVAGAIAALWTLHPIQTEAVNYVTQRTEVLVSLFFLGTLYSSIRLWDAESQRTRRRWFALAVASCLLGMGTKEVMVSAPLMVLLYDRAFRYRRWAEAWDRSPFYSSLAATTLVLFAFMAGRPRGVTVGFGLGIEWFDYFYTQAWAIGRYAQLALWPDRLVSDYGVRPISGAAGIPGLIVLTIFLAATIRAWLRPNTQGWFAFAGAWFFLILGPSSSVVPIVSEVAAERRFYLPLVSLLVLMAVAIEVLRRRAGHAAFRSGKVFAGILTAVAVAYSMFSGWKARIAFDSGAVQVIFRIAVGLGAAAVLWSLLRRRAVAVVLIATALFATTWARSRTYANSVRLWEDAIVKMPNNARAWENLGATLANDGLDPVRAESMFLKAISVDPDYVPAYFHAGASALEAGRVSEAKALFEEGLRVNPGFMPLLASYGNLLLSEGDVKAALPILERASVRPPSEQTLIDLATAYMLSGRANDAIRVYRAVLDADPGRTDLLRFAGLLLVQDGRAAEALPYLAEAAMREPTSGLGLSLLGLAYAHVGQEEGAYQFAARAAAMAEDDPRTLLFAGRAMLLVDRASEAERTFAEGVRLHPDDGGLVTGLAHARLSLGRRSEAADLFRRALDLDPDNRDAREGLQRATSR